MKNAWEYQFVTSFIKEEDITDYSQQPRLSSLESKLNKKLLDIIDDAEGSGRENEFEIVSHSITQINDGFLLSFLFRLKVS